ncbi:cyclin-A2-4-like [Macadamia integrifolia]|uniref:cyclin-A2-4-like n=1 Tax=Macadamia integrifolia TaxID=60698 RepID=UPI001C4F5581|nr:cyclin-A2-4-like [Macadamia integrifolia]
MKRENMSVTGFPVPTARITRARAAAFQAAGVTLPLQPSAKQDQKRALRENSKRVALDENNSSAPVAGDLQHKRRAVLKEVTNLCCENLHTNCINAAKLQSKNSKKAKRGPLKKDSKVVPSNPVPEVQKDVTALSAEKIEKSEKAEPQEVACSTEVKGHFPMQISMGSMTIRSVGCDPQANIKICRWPPQLSSPLKKDKYNLCENLGSSSCLGITDIDSDDKDPQMCSLYAADIYSNLRVVELVRRPSCNFMETLQRDITQSMRGILVDWLVEVAEEYKLVQDTLYLAVYFIDRFLSANYMSRQRLQLLGITCMLIASKYEEICAPRVEEFCFITDNTYTKGEVLQMESQVLNYLGFQLSAPTAKTFLRRFLRAAQASYKVPSLELEFLANYLSELTLIEYTFLKFLPSLIAASAVFLARWILDQSCHPWNPTLEHYTTYKASDLKVTVLALQDLHTNTNSCPLNAVREKYKQQKFKYVATVTSPNPHEMLF